MVDIFKVVKNIENKFEEAGGGAELDRLKGEGLKLGLGSAAAAVGKENIQDINDTVVNPLLNFAKPSFTEIESALPEQVSIDPDIKPLDPMSSSADVKLNMDIPYGNIETGTTVNRNSVINNPYFRAALDSGGILNVNPQGVSASREFQLPGGFTGSVNAGYDWNNTNRTGNIWNLGFRVGKNF